MAEGLIPVIGQTPIERMIRSLQDQVLQLKRGNDTGWITPTLLNSWINYSSSGGFQQARYRRLNGIVYVQGLIAGGTLTTIFTLPAGFRPLRQHIFTSIAGGAIGRVDVDSAGNVIAVSGANSFFSLAEIVFPAEA